MTVENLVHEKGQSKTNSHVRELIVRRGTSPCPTNCEEPIWCHQPRVGTNEDSGPNEASPRSWESTYIQMTQGIMYRAKRDIHVGELVVRLGTFTLLTNQDKSGSCRQPRWKSIEIQGKMSVCDPRRAHIEYRATHPGYSVQNLIHQKRQNKARYSFRRTHSMSWRGSPLTNCDDPSWCCRTKPDTNEIQSETITSSSARIPSKGTMPHQEYII